jgi:ribosomal protein S30
MPTHGFLTKAGKVRNQTSAISSLDDKKSVDPRQRNHRKQQPLLADQRDDHRR